jgi:hypothetical protein
MATSNPTCRSCDHCVLVPIEDRRIPRRWCLLYRREVSTGCRCKDLRVDGLCPGEERHLLLSRAPIRVLPDELL